MKNFQFLDVKVVYIAFTFALEIDIYDILLEGEQESLVTSLQKLSPDLYLHGHLIDEVKQSIR